MKIFLPVLFALVLLLSFSLIPAVPANADGNTYYVATTGSDDTGNGSGSEGNPWLTITYAISQASAGDTISVANGTYTDNVTVNKQLTLTGDLSQPSNVVVDAGGSGSAITLTVDGCVVQGFKVQNGEHGIYLDNGSSNNTLTSNIANSNTEHGIYLNNGSSNNTLAENTANSNAECGIYLDNSDSNTLTSNIANLNTKYGIYLDGKDGSHGNTLTGNTANQNGECGIYLDRSNNNTLARNTVSRNNEYGINLDNNSNNNTLTGNHIIGSNIGVNIQSAVDASTISINFNNIYGNTTYGVDNTHGTSDVDAENNWWGAKDGPSGVGPGTGDVVSENVDYGPWLGNSLVDSKTETTASGDQTVDAKTGADTEVDKSGTGTPTITVAKYSDNPGGNPIYFSAIGKYIDVHTNNTTDVDEIVIKVYYTNAEITGLVESSLKLRWWDGTRWVMCSDSGATYPSGGPTYRGFMWARIGADTMPKLSDLKGSPFAGSGVPPPAVTVFLPAISNLAITPTENGIAEVKMEEAVTITAEVINKGDGSGSYTVTLKINGVVDEKKTVTLAPWEKKTVTFTVIKEKAGTFKVLVNGFVAEFFVSEPPPPPSATFEVTNLSISPAKVKAGETVTISVLVSETSGGSGDHNVILKINGVVMEQHEVTLGSQQSQTVTFTIANQEAGGCKVEVNGLVSEFIVEAPPSEVSPPPAPTLPAKPPINWAMLWYIIGGVAVVGLIIFFLARRRAY